MKFKCRASALKNFMSPVTGSKFNETCKSVIIAQAVKDATGFQVPLRSKYTIKGNDCEDDAIELLGSLTYQSIKKNEQHFEDDHFTGTPDIITTDAIRDTKCSFSKDTFPTQYGLEKQVVQSGYDLQGQVYMHLTGKRKHYVDYLLLPTPLALCYTPEEVEMYHDWTIRLHEIDPRHAHRFTCIEFDESVIDRARLKIESAEVQEFYQEIYEAEPKLIMQFDKGEAA